MFNFFHTFIPNRILIEIGPLTIYWYGLFVALGIFLGLLLVVHLAKQYNIHKDKIYNLAFYLLIFGLLGDRLYEVLSNWGYYSNNLLDVFKIWQGGLAIHGAMIAGLIVLYVFGKRNKISFWLLGDLIIPALALGEAIGRWGNYFNQELYGTPTDLPWGIPIEFPNRVEPYLNDQFFHPTFLYLGLWCLLVAGVLIFMHKARVKMPETKLLKPGNIMLSYFFLYSVGRFTVEMLRLDPMPVIGDLRLAQWASLVLIVGSVVIFLYREFVQIRTN